MSEEIKREELRQVIAKMYDDSLTSRLWQGIGRFLSRLIVRRNRVAPLWLASLVAIAFGVLGSSLFAWAIHANEFFSWENMSYILIISFWPWLSINLVDWQVRKNLTAIKSHALEILDFTGGEEEVLKVVKLAANHRLQLLAAISYFLTIGAGVIVSMEFDFTQPLSWAIVMHFMLGLGLWVPHMVWGVVLIVFYGVYFRRWPLRLFQDNPSGTVSLQVLHRCSSQLLIISALIAALMIPVGVFMEMMTNTMLIISAVGLWIPLLLFYIASESTFSGHIGLVKNKRLMQLQKQISELEQRSDIPNVETIKQVRELLEFHEKINRTPNSLVNVESLLNLFGSLALPFLGALLNIFDMWKNFFSNP